MCGYEMNLGAMSMPMNPTGTFALTASVALTAQQIMGTVMNKIATQMSDISKKQTEQTTRSNVKNTYVSILVMEQTVGLLDSSLANMQRLSNITNEGVKAGAVEQIDADKLAVQVASLRNSINSTQRSLTLLYNSLILQLGADVDAQLNLTSSLDDILSVEKAVQLTNHALNLDNNYSYQLLEQNEKLTKDQLTLAWLAFTPTLSAYYQYNYKTYFGRDEAFNMTPPNMIGASISWPLFQSGTRMAGIRKAKISYQENLNSKQQAEDGLKVQYRQMCSNLISALESYQIQRENLDVTQRVFSNTSEKYRYGRASSLEVTNASTDIISAQNSYIQAVMTVISSQIALEDLLCEEE